MTVDVQAEVQEGLQTRTDKKSVGIWGHTYERVEDTPAQTGTQCLCVNTNQT